ncbi:FG-GAP-like repeat-containing protein, partial [Streptomyces sp. NPDC127084]|uniref:FG-GAP-like repeat-containing protein n=1 Tax=Streptomyces sp. NPDC127084 TaxID=3347133 RepID=UPI003669C420
VGDFNGDGDQDLATANAAVNTVSVLVNNGDGTFAAPADYPTGNGPRSVAVADLDGDGALDLVTANSLADTVSVLGGNGDGTFAAPVDYPTGDGPRSVAVGDFNGDGYLDLATADTPADTVSVLLNTTALPVTPVITSPANGATINDSTPTFTGTGGPGDTITITDENDTVICTAIVNAAGNWTCTALAPIPDGQHTFTPTATNPQGSTTGQPVTVTITTTTPPVTPVITSPANASTITCDTLPHPYPHTATTRRGCTLTFTGTGGPGDTITITDENDTVICTAIVNAAG